MPNVHFITSYAEPVPSLIVQDAPPGFETTVHPANLSDAELIERVHDADFLILFPSRLADNVLRAMPQLKLIQLVSAGFDQMNLALCQELGVPIANNGGANSIDVAEHTIAMMLAMYRRFRELDVNVRHNGWRAIDTGVCTYTIDGKTVGIIGMGNIGQKVARRLQGWGARVIYYDAYPPSAEVEQALNVTRVTLDELAAEADLITLHTPLNAETRGILSHAQFARMKPNAIVVNTCRGPVIDEAALIQALQQGQIAGAALDVLEKEPPAPDNPLLQMENVLFTPHSAGITYDTWRRRGQFIFENLQRVWNGQAPLAVIG
ncbi:MAG: D-isomer specific 2-hydroxyacid dehydrogenase family protein [Caldilineaceae bacterium]